MIVRLVAVAFDAHDPDELAAFWAAVLGRDIVGEPSGALVPGDDTQVGLRFVAAATERSGPNRLHLHLTSPPSTTNGTRSKRRWRSGVATWTWGSSRRRTTWCWPTPAATSSA